MKIIKSIPIYIVVAFTLLTGSCNYLNVDEYFNDVIPTDTIFARKEFLERYIWGAAALMPAEGNLYSNSYGPYMTATDECQMSWRSTEYAGTLLQADEVTPFSSYYNFYAQYYKGIRKTNVVFTRINECKDLNNVDKRDMLGLTYFLRAYFYYSLVQLYGPVPIVPENPMDVSSDTEDLLFPRNTYDECIEYICSDLSKAAELLEEKRVSTFINRPTKYAALALMSRVRLVQASPWFNGNSFYSDWKTEEGKNFVSQEYNESIWALSAIASKRIIESGKYMLHTVPSDEHTAALPANVPPAQFPDGAGGIDPFRSYSEMFNGETLDVKNPELIYLAPLNVNVTKITFPIYMGGWNGLGITQELVDAYYMKDGSDYVQAPDDYKAMAGTKKISSTFTLNEGNGAAVAQMYNNRETRFYATVGFCEDFWPGTSILGTDQNPEARSNQVVTYYKDGTCAPQAANPEDYNLTGYTCKKYIHPEDNHWSKGVVKPKTYPVFRYAEILLNYVEAINELTKSYADSTATDGSTITVAYDPTEIAFYFNQIRYRAGLPGITGAQAGNPAIMRQLIKRERMIEFAHEGRRYHDVRRWGIAMDTENKPVRGMDVTQKKSNREGFYKVVTIDHKYAQRNFSQKMYFYPIPRAVIDLNPKLIQNPGW